MIFSVVSVLSSCNLLDYTIYFLLLQDGNGWNVGFFVCDLFAIYCLRFLFGDCFAWYCLLAVGFLARFFASTPTSWVSTLTFLLAFLLLRPHRGFPRLFSYFHAQFPLPDISISFRGGLFCLLFTPYAHAVGFSAYFSAPTPKSIDS